MPKSLLACASCACGLCWPAIHQVAPTCHGTGWQMERTEAARSRRRGIIPPIHSLKKRRRRPDASSIFSVRRMHVGTRAGGTQIYARIPFPCIPLTLASLGAYDRVVFTKPEAGRPGNWVRVTFFLHRVRREEGFALEAGDAHMRILTGAHHALPAREHSRSAHI